MHFIGMNTLCRFEGMNSQCEVRGSVHSEGWITDCLLEGGCVFRYIHHRRRKRGGGGFRAEAPP